VIIIRDQTCILYGADQASIFMLCDLNRNLLLDFSIA